MSSLITIFGATGLQGGSVIKAIQQDDVLSKKFKIRGITRNLNSESSRKLTEQGIKLVSANQDDPESLITAIQGSDTVFLVTSFENSYSFATEVQQGKNVVDACKKTAVKHLIFSSLVDIKRASNGAFTKVYHFDSKAEIERYIHSTGIPFTIVLAGSYMQNLFSLIRKGEDGTYSMTLPTEKEALFPMIDVATDYGKFVKPVLKSPGNFLGKSIYAATKYYTSAEMRAIFEEKVGFPVQFNVVSPAMFEKFMPQEMAEDLTEMLQAFVSPGYYGGVALEESLALVDEKLVDLGMFLTENREKFL